MRKQAFTIPVTILVADASPSYREITRKMLKFYDASFVVDDCASIESCLKKAGNRAYDILLVNERLEDGDCIALLSALRHHDIEVPVLVLYEEGNETEARRACDLGAIDYIIKERGYLTALPFNVKKALERRDAELTEPAEESIGPDPTPFVQRGYFILNHRGRFLSANPGMESISGFAEDELLELTVLDILPKGKEWELFEWLQEIERGTTREPFRSELVGKFGAHVPVAMQLTPIRDEEDQLKSYRGEIHEISPEPAAVDSEYDDQFSLDFVESIWELAAAARNEPMPKLLGKLAQLACQKFKFQRATVAILDKPRRAFVKVAMIGYSLPDESERRRLEVPREVIDEIFAAKHRIKVLYHSQDQRQSSDLINPMLPERRGQHRRGAEEWHPRDVVLLSLAAADMQTYGYISLDSPVQKFKPARSFFHNLELFSRVASMLIENQAYSLDQDQRSRRLTQVLVTSNIFKLYLSMAELLKEVVWSVKFSLDFNLVVLALISEKSGMAEVRSVACDDKVKAQQIGLLRFNLTEFMALFDPEEKVGRAHLIRHRSSATRAIKQIYHAAEPAREPGEWPESAMLAMPLKSRHGKIMGAILVDDPAEQDMPDSEHIRTLEILANQVSVAIENRILHVEAKRQRREPARRQTVSAPNNNSARMRDFNHSKKIYSRRSFWDKIFKE